MRRKRVPFDKPPLTVQTTTLWDYPSQHYGRAMQGDQRYIGATPSYVIWNLLQRYTKKGDTVVDPMCGSGTTLDVARDLQREGRGFDLNPFRSDIEKSDARKLPLKSATANLVFIDPPYGDHIHYSDDPACIGHLSAHDDAYFKAMDTVFAEATRVLKDDGILAIYVCDFFNKKTGFVPTGTNLFVLLSHYVMPVDHVCIVRHNKGLNQGQWHRTAAEQNFFLRGFNHLLIGKKVARK